MSETATMTTSIAFVSRRPLTDMTGYARYSSDVIAFLRSLGCRVSPVNGVSAADEATWVVLSHLDAVRVRDVVRWRGKRVIYLAHNEEVATRLTVARFDRWYRRIWQLARLPWLVVRQALVVRRAEMVIAISDEDASRFRRRYGIEAAVLPPSLIDPPANDVTTEPSIVLWGSYRWSVKRENARWALRDVLPKVSRDVHLVIAGLDADRLRTVRTLPARVSFADSITHPASIFRSRPLVLVAERQTGGVKLKTLDAAVAGCPIVSTPSGIEGTGLRHGRGVLIGNDASELAEHIDALVADWPRALRLGEEARSVVCRYIDQRRGTAAAQIIALLSQKVGG